jgi:hypothetical protein
MIKIFLVTEFTGLHQATSLISLALVAETCEEFYVEFTDYDPTQLFPWLEENVMSQLFIEENSTENHKAIRIKGNRNEVKNALEQWFLQFPQAKNSIQIWADCYAWDWVLFCELFGGAFGIPGNIHYMTMDLATFLFSKGFAADIERNKLLPSNYQDKDNLKLHNALYDARIEMVCLKKMMKLIFSNTIINLKKLYNFNHPLTFECNYELQ